MPDALLHAAGQLVDGAVGERLESDEAELLQRDPAALWRRDAAHPQPEFDVAGDVEPGHQRVLLEHDAAVGAGAGHRALVEQDRALRRRQESRNAIEKRCLAAARRADRDDEIARAQRQRDAG